MEQKECDNCGKIAELIDELCEMCGCDHDWDLEERSCLNCGKEDEDWVERVFKRND